jgi:hypothetical protein
VAINGIDAWGLDYFATLVVAYVAVLIAALAVAGGRRLLSRSGRMAGIGKAVGSRRRFADAHGAYSSTTRR